MSKSVCRQYDWAAVAAEYGLWVAQYANNNATGYQANPWTDAKASSMGNARDLPVFFRRSFIRLQRKSGYEYRIHGRGSMESLRKGTQAIQTPKADAPNGSVLDLVYGVMTGKYGNGDARKAALGSRYNEVQSEINHIQEASAETLAVETKAGRYGNGDVRKAVLGRQIRRRTEDH